MRVIAYVCELSFLCDLKADTHIAYVAWRFWLCALSNKGGRGQRNREEIGAGANFSPGFAASAPGSTKPPCYTG